MTRSERFFVWLWRANGVIFFVLGVLGFVGAAVLIFNLTQSSPHSPPERQLALIAGTDRAAKDLSLSHFDEIGGTGFLYAELGAYSESAGKGFSSGGASRITHNLLFFSTAAKTAHWLLPSNDQTILSFHFLSDPPRPQYKDYEGQSPRPEQVTVAILVEIAEGAQTPDVPSRLRALGIASADGRGFTTVSRSINELLGYHQMGKDSVLIFYVSDGQAKVMDLDPMARKVRSDDPLSMQ